MPLSDQLPAIVVPMLLSISTPLPHLQLLTLAAALQMGCVNAGMGGARVLVIQKPLLSDQLPARGTNAHTNQHLPSPSTAFNFGGGVTDGMCQYRRARVLVIYTPFL